jgi:hypothetical protein
MDEPTQDDLCLDDVNAVALETLTRIGDDPQARFAIVKQLLAVVQEIAEERGQ